MAGAALEEPEQVIELDEPEAGLSGVLVIDRTIDGVAAGGIRRASYGSREAAREEALALARAMSVKCALAELPAGGAKAVIRADAVRDPERAYRALGEVVDELGGGYLAGPDVGTAEVELDHVRSVTEHVNPSANEPARSTARGVLAGIRGVLATIDGEPRIEGSRFLVQGYGHVGSRLADALARRGGQVLVAEVDPERRRAAEAAGHGLVEPEQATRTPCTVFVPCALGGVLTVSTARQLPARGVCGSANEQLAAQEAGAVLHERGVAYAPDVLVNAGAVVEGVLTTREGRREAVLEEVAERIASIEDRVRELLERSRAEGIPPHRLALEAARNRLSES